MVLPWDNCHQDRKWWILAEAKSLQTAASLRAFYFLGYIVSNLKIAHPVSLRSWSRSAVILATRKSRLQHREQKRVVAPSDPSAPVHRQQDRFDFIAGEGADYLKTMSFP